MGKRLQCDMFSVSGIPYTVEIHDTDWSGAVSDVIGDLETFNIEWAGSSNNLHSEIMASAAEFKWESEAYNAAHELFIEELTSASEERFYMRILENGLFVWQGFIITDEVNYPDESVYVSVSITAVDGIQRAKDIQYRDNENDADYTGKETLLNHLFNCFDQIAQPFPGLTPQARFKTNIDWYTADMVTTDSALAQAVLSHEAFTYQNDRGVQVYTSTWEVIRAIAALTEARFYFAKGSYWLMQPSNYRNATQRIFEYGVNRQLSNIVVTDFNIDIDNINRLKVAAVRFNYLPPLDKYTVIYNHKTAENLVTGTQFPYQGGAFYILSDSVYLPADNNTSLKIRIKFRTRSNIGADNPTEFYTDHRYYFRVDFNIGVHNLSRISEETQDFFEYDEEDFVWSIGGSTPLLSSKIISVATDQTDVYTTYEIETPPLPTAANGDTLRMSITLEDVLTSQNNAPTNNGNVINGPIHDWSTAEVDVRFQDLQFNEYTISQSKLGFITESDFEGNTRNKTVNTSIGDGPQDFTTSKLEFNDIPTSEWRSGVSTSNVTYQNINSLNSAERLRLQKKPVELITGTLIANDIQLSSKIVIGTKGYIPLNLRFSAFNDSYSATYAYVDYVPDVNILPPIQLPPIGLPGGGAGNVSDDNIFDTGFIVNDSNDIVYPTPNLFSLSSPNLIPNQLAKYVSSARASNNHPSFVNKANGQNEIFVQAQAEVFAVAGSRFWLVNASTGRAESLTVSADYVSNASTLSIDEDITGQYPHGSYIIMQGNANSSTVTPPSAVGDCQIQKELNQSGTHFDITVTNFPSDDTELDAKVTLLRQGLNVLHGVGYTVDRSVSPVQIVFQNTTLRNEHLVLKCCNTAAAWTERYIDFSGTLLTLSAGNLSDITDFDLQLEVVKSGIEIFKDFPDGYTVDTVNNTITLLVRSRGENIFIKKKS